MKRLIAALIVVWTANAVSGDIVADPFDGNTLGPNWEVLTQIGGTFCNVAAGRLKVGGSAGQTGELIIRYKQAIGDVGHLRIDYDWEYYTGHKARVGIALYDHDAYWDGVDSFTG